MLELCRASPDIKHLVYASSSSVYGGNTKVPFAEGDRVDNPVSIYAATKKADELISSTYSHLYGLPQTGLRFFTVYGPWGRPDMAAWIFTEAMLAGKPIRVFNHGEMWRDFTYIDDIVDGVLAVLDRPPPADGPRHLVYNIGNDTANAQTSAHEHDALVTQLKNRQQSLSGVSIDEEAAQVLQFQRSFQASAQMISAVNQMMQTALAMTAG